MYTRTPWTDGAHIQVAAPVLAVAMPTRHSLVIGTEHDMRVFDPTNGQLTHLHHIPVTRWLAGQASNMLVPDDLARPQPTPAYVAVAGHPGGGLPGGTSDHWTYSLQPQIGRIIASLQLNGQAHAVHGAGDLTMAGFSRDGLAFVLMTTGGLFTAYRESLSET